MATESANGMRVYARTVVEGNIKHLRTLLQVTTQPPMQQNLIRVLAREEAKLAKLLHQTRQGESTAGLDF